ncbi:MAG: hypothetical protein L0H78_18350, partial [Humibacillus sp.]|nr:hypothetical protein [Humibacillus sp.]
MSAGRQVQDEVRDRYAQAARAVTIRTGNPLELVDAAGCCGSTSVGADARSLTEQTASCCGGSGTQV